MNIFGRKDPSPNEWLEADRVKKSITQSLGTSLNSFQKQYAQSQEEPIYSGEMANAVCDTIEAVFLHGLKSSVSSKISTFLVNSNPDQRPQLSFWQFLCKYTHKDVISQLSHLGQITTEIGMCRAWIRIALNDCVLESYVDAMLADEAPLRYYYRSISYLRDPEQPGILKTYLQGLSSFEFQLSYNSTVLNSWSHAPLMLAGLWQPPQTPTAVLGAASDTPSARPKEASNHSSPIAVKHRSLPRIKNKTSSTSSLDSLIPKTPVNTPCDVTQISDNTIDDIRKLVLKQNSGLDLSEAIDKSCGSIADSEPRSIDVPPNTPYDVSAIATRDLDDLRKLAIDPNQDSVASSVDSTGSHISHPDFTDSRDMTYKPVDMSITTMKVPDSPCSELVTPPSNDRIETLMDTNEKSVLAELGNWVLGGIKKTPPLFPIVSSSGLTPDLSSFRRRSSDDSVFLSRKESVSIYDSGRTISGKSPTPCEDIKQRRDSEEEQGISYYSDRNYGNSLGMMSGWSSSFEPDSPHGNTEIVKEPTQEMEQSREQEFSFDSLVRNYSSVSVKNTSTSFKDVMDSSLLQQSNLLDSESTLVPEISDIECLDYEVLPIGSALTSTKADARTQELVSIICHICNEKGLDQQSYQCKACNRPIGIIYGKPRVCTYDGGYYCYDCHNDDEYYIPSRIIHNWDFRKHKVSVGCMEFLTKIEQEPLINLDTYNPRVYQHVPEMNEIRVLRQQLRFLKSYLFTCSQNVADELRKKVWPKEYLYEDVQLYSLSDLLLAQSGQLTQQLKKIVRYASKHVYECRLCCQKGFICEICNSAKVIYPFETESTMQCKRCKSVFHKQCKTDFKPCPKCERRKQRSSVGTPDINTPEVVDYAFMPED